MIVELAIGYVLGAVWFHRVLPPPPPRIGRHEVLLLTAFWLPALVIGAIAVIVINIGTVGRRS